MTNASIINLHVGKVDIHEGHINMFIDMIHLQLEMNSHNVVFGVERNRFREVFD